MRHVIGAVNDQMIKHFTTEMTEIMGLLKKLAKTATSIDNRWYITSWVLIGTVTPNDSNKDNNTNDNDNDNRLRGW